MKCKKHREADKQNENAEKCIVCEVEKKIQSSMNKIQSSMNMKGLTVDIKLHGEEE